MTAPNPESDNTRDRWIGPKWLQDLVDRLYRTTPVSRYDRRRLNPGRLADLARRESGYTPRDGSISHEQWWDEHAQERSQVVQEPELKLPDSDGTEDERAAAAARLADNQAIERARRTD